MYRTMTGTDGEFSDTLSAFVNNLQKANYSSDEDIKNNAVTSKVLVV